MDRKCVCVQSPPSAPPPVAPAGYEWEPIDSQPPSFKLFTGWCCDFRSTFTHQGALSSVGGEDREHSNMTEENGETGCQGTSKHAAEDWRFEYFISLRETDLKGLSSIAIRCGSWQTNYKQIKFKWIRDNCAQFPLMIIGLKRISQNVTKPFSPVSGWIESFSEL